MSTSDDLRVRAREPRVDAGGAGATVHPIPSAPAYESLPEPRRRSARGGPALCSVSVAVEVVTPILGGGSQTRALDDVDVIRPAAVRGHLRFWWRALRGHEFAGADDLYTAESALWGRAVTDGEGRSAVEICVEVQQAGVIDTSDIHLVHTPGAYALWPARAERRTSTPPAPRRKPGTRFRLTLIGPKGREAQLRDVIRAWLLFGGYGSRTRRGLGAFTVTDDAGAWLPAQATRKAFKDLFGGDVFVSPNRAALDTPWLAGAALQVGNPDGDAVKAWTTALDWLKEFRQGTSGRPGDRAREPGAGKPQPQRPSISNWPEADKVRRLCTARRGLLWAHPPRHNATPAWPRAGFGLPVVGQFQQQSRIPRPAGQNEPRNLRWDECTPAATEPDGFELRWRSAAGEHDRLASPLIVKALPLADGMFVPCALWLNRAYPAGEVVLRGVQDSGAPFDRLVASGDTPVFSALAGKSGLRNAFLDWLHGKYGTTVVAP